MLDFDGKYVLEGLRSSDNCYTLISPLHTCHKVISNDIHHHFIRDLVDSNVLILKFAEIGKLADIFTKALDFVNLNS